MLMFKLFAFFILINSSIIAFAGGSAGGRGGGTGISCNNKIYLLEEYKLRENNIRYNKIHTRPQALEHIKRTLFFNTSLLERVVDIWQRNKGYNHWQHTYDEDIEKDHLQDKTKNSQCHFIALSHFKNGEVSKVAKYEENLTEHTKRMLEIHEALFMVGMHYYDHIFSVKTINLIVASYLTPEILSKSIRDFYLPSKKIHESKFSGLYKLKTYQPYCSNYLAIGDEASTGGSIVKIKLSTLSNDAVVSSFINIQLKSATLHSQIQPRGSLLKKYSNIVRFNISSMQRETILIDKVTLCKYKRISKNLKQIKYLIKASDYD